MAVTTNYSWSTPDDTALVKDGASAIRSLGTAIDTTVFNNASAAIAKTIVDAKGDIIAATAADTVSRLAVGANDTVLTADSTAATGLKWATPATGGGMTLISTTTLSGASTTISSIPTTYVDLQIIIQNVNCSSNSYVIIKPNNVTSLTNLVGVVRAVSTTAFNQYSNAEIQTYDSYASGNTSNIQQIQLKNYASSTAFKPFVLSAFYTAAAGAHTEIMGGAFRSNTAVTSLVFATSAGTFSGGTVLLYGVK